MINQCPTCGGKLASYESAPPGYCVQHSAWLVSNIRCASILSEQDECSDRWDGDDFGLVCPTDGTRIASSIIPSEIIHGDHPAAQQARKALLQLSASGDIQKEDFQVPCKKGMIDVDTGEKDHKGCTTCGGKGFTWAGTNEERIDTILRASGGGLSATASFQKTALWYYIKPRWIIRRKMQAAIRRKVRSHLAPLTSFKTRSSNIDN